MRKIGIISFLMIILLLFVQCTGKPDYGKEELVEEVYSPNGKITAKIYQGPPDDAVMVDFYVVVEIEYKENVVADTREIKEMIYYKYHDEYENAYWIDDNCLVVNGIEIDVNDKETWVNDKGD